MASSRRRRRFWFDDRLRHCGLGSVELASTVVGTYYYSSLVFLTMATLRQHENGFYLALSDAKGPVSTSDLRALLSSVMLDFERRLTTKLFDVNRTVSALTSEKRRLVLVENVPEIVFRRCFNGVMCGSAAAPTTLSELLSIVPAHSLVRRHHAGDFCLIAPLFKCTHHFSNSSLTSSSLAPHTPGFFVEPQELFVPLKPAAFSERVVEVITPFPGEMPDDPGCIDPEKYPSSISPIICRSSSRP